MGVALRLRGGDVSPTDRRELAEHLEAIVAILRRGEEAGADESSRRAPASPRRRRYVEISPEDLERARERWRELRGDAEPNPNRDPDRRWKRTDAEVADLPDLHAVDPSEGGIYFIRAGQYVKIGRAKDVSRRVVRLQVGNHLKLHLMLVVAGDATTERALHAHFGHLRKGGEWFRYTGELRRMIRRLQP